MSRKGWLIRVLTVSAVILLAPVSGVVAGTLLVINADTSDPAPRAAFEQLVADFQKDHLDLQVQLTVYDHEAFKPAIRLFLIFDAPDVVTWYVGERMKTFVSRDLFEDASDLWADNGLEQTMASSLSAMTIDGKQSSLCSSFPS
jgi:multiple sugar transport system substrate-binding protein